ncbi:SMC family ATPase [Nocardioides sp.]|uniref:SMC family ATPase n=1 Tax=Nocardioides sp. TaxID=35761 RepID=UPI002D809070|nr:SMC family ATPase [Nocardioides sp.]HET8961027.1 SMC family ATPase [Nocardioides sp.]
MRLHHLQVEAFGPFADRVAVDFDALSEAGLFLLTGATGAGKTSILDAVCFALYGEVPGDRQSAKRLRADQAADGETPRVTLELTLAGRRFRIVRSPAWQRPKKRGTGTTTQQASVKLCERRGEAWHPLSTRLDEAGHQITHLVGLNLTQFCQVAMLPQGRFQAFLRARSEERHKLLQQLFRTVRFEEVERWLADRRRTLRRDSLGHHDQVADLVSRLSEAAASPLPAGWDLHDLGPAAEIGEVARWLVDRRGAAEASAREAAARRRTVVAEEAAARESLQRARTLREAQQRHAAARTERDRLAAAAPDHARQVDRLARARRATEVAPLGRVADQQAHAAARAREVSAARTRDAVAELGLTGAGPDSPDLVDVRDRAVATAADARALLPREVALGALRQEVDDASARLRQLRTERDELAQLLTELPDQVAAQRAQESESREATRDLAVVRDRVVSLRSRHEAAELAVGLTAELAAATDLHRDAVDEAQQLRENWLQVQEQRIRGIAAELAGALVVGGDCPVCGSAEHPRPASPDAGAPDASTEKAARKRVDDAEAARHAHHLRVRELAGRLEAARSAADGDPASLGVELAAEESELRRLTALADSLAERQASLAAVETRHSQLAERHNGIDRELAVTSAALERRREESATIERELSALLSGSGCDRLDALAVRHDEIATACSAALLARDDARRADQAVSAVRKQLEQAAVDAGFDDARAALESALDPTGLSRLEREVRAHEQAVAGAESTLSDPGLRDQAALPAPDVAALETVHQQTVDHLTAATTAADVGRTRAERVAGLGDRLEQALEAWAPVRAQLELTTRLAALVDGSSADNRLRMRLSGYVLAARLAQVVAAANVRLSRMSDQRYALEHTGGRGAGESRGGLSLRVRDEWSGEARDPATLSGGETFVVSLALALGLADVIAHEVGGADLDTLFVDEGFGSLDAETLDDVMDTLDTLREGGRVVGVVSHVAHLRERIPTQLHVEKRRHGSAVRTVHAR